MNHDSVRELIQSQYQGLVALLRRKLRDDQLAYDTLNQAIVTSLEHLQAGRVADVSHIAGYVFQVAMNHVRNHRRKMDERGDRRAAAEALDSVASEPASESADQDKLAALVRKVLEGLPTARDREIVKRFYLDEEDKDALCKDLGLSPLHFDKVIFRARQRMRALLDEAGFRRSDYLSLLLVGAA